MPEDHPEKAESTNLGFRRRCAWCGVQLRGWQLNLCRLCGPRAKGDAGIYLSAGGPPCRSGSRWNAEPDRLRTPPVTPAPPCRQCGPGYRIGDEGCRHTEGGSDA